MGSFVLHAQSAIAKTDKDHILIGERLEYDLMLDLPTDGYEINVKVPDSVAHFEIIENKNFDTVSSSGSFLISKKIIFTSFDSGSWRLPSLEVLLNKNNVSSKLITDSLLINVGYSPTDSTNELRDIKPVMEVTVTDYTWLYIAGGVLVAIIIIVLLYFYFKNRKKKPLPVFHSALSPYDEAMKALIELKQYDLDKPEQVKNYHVSLDAIFKKYYSRKQSKNMMNKTTGDILIDIKEQSADPELLSSVAAALRCGDAVKFAKYIPAISESEKSHSLIKDAIEKMEQDQSPQKQ